MMKTMTKTTAILLAIVMATNLHAAEKKEKEDNRNPLGCRDTGYRYNLKTLELLPLASGSVQSMYFIFNKSGRTINLFQMLDSDTSSRSMYLNHTIKSGNWAVLATSEKQMKYICTAPDSGSRYGDIVDCAETIHVCEYNNVKFGLNNRGNYWIVNGNTRGGAIQEVLRYGIIPAL